VNLHPAGSGSPGEQNGDEVVTETPAATVARNSASMAVWTVVGRVTGFARITLIAAVLGPTFFGNLFQSVNLLPNIVYEFMAGNLIIALLVPPLVQRLDLGDRDDLERLAGGFLGVMLVAFTAAAVLAVALGPLIVRALSLGVDDPDELAKLVKLGWVLLALVAPQLLLYGVAGSGVAVQHAHGRYKLAAAAPALENVGLIVVLAVYAAVFGLGSDLQDVGLPQVVLLGLGSTCAVGLHAGAEWWGARRVGCTLIPRAGWRDPEVRAIVRLAIPSVAYAGLNAVRYFGILVVAGTVPGGVVAFALAVNFFNLPVAIGGRTIAWAQVPRLSRLHHTDDRTSLFKEWNSGMAASFFLVVPAGVAYVALAHPLAEAFSFGEMATPRGVSLVTASLASLGLGVVGESAFIHATQGCYARRDVAAPLRAMMLRTGLTVVGMVVAAVAFEGVSTLVMLGLTITTADITTGALLSHWLRTTVAPHRAWAFRPLLQAVGASMAMVVPAYLIADRLPLLVGEGRVGDLGAVALAVVVGGAVYLLIQRIWHSDELDWLRSSVRGGVKAP
jgi:putative peptidoglycan lipid II flippase